MQFTNKIAVITGGANGIGRKIAADFKSHGAVTVIIDKDNSQSLDCDMFYHGDIADETVLRNFAAEVVAKYGGIDYLINNACLSRGGILSESCGYEEFLYVQKVGVTAPYMLAKLFLPHFKNNSSIVNISSTRASMSQANTESYSAAKGGISALTHALAVSLAGKVRVNSISPGWIDNTDGEFSSADKSQHPAGRIGTPADISNMAMFLCSHEQNGFITGENITIDGGMTKLMIYHNDNGWEYAEK